jgi:ribose 5-phosphate isomerase B
MNILVFGARVIGSELAKELARIFVAARFTGEARHVRRLAKVHAMEERYGMQMPVGSATRSS